MNFDFMTGFRIDEVILKYIKAVTSVNLNISDTSSDLCLPVVAEVINYNLLKSDIDVPVCLFHYSGYIITPSKVLMCSMDITVSCNVHHVLFAGGVAVKTRVY
jgi:hypothetical protein